MASIAMGRKDGLAPRPWVEGCVVVLRGGVRVPSRRDDESISNSRPTAEINKDSEGAASTRG